MAASRPSILDDIGIDQKLNAQVSLELPFRDEAGQTVRLGDYFKDRPVVLALVYYRCPMLCTLVLNGTVRALRAVPLTPGKDFEVVAVSFDPREGSELAAEKKANYLKTYGHPETASGWHFLTGDEASIRKLTDAVGFRYKWDEANKQYAHASAIMVLTPQGKVSKYFYSVEYSSRDLRLALVEASENKIGSRVDQVLLYCYHYDPTTGKYGLAVMNLIRAGGALTLLALGTFIAVSTRRDRRRRRKEADADAMDLAAPETDSRFDPGPLVK